MTEISMCDNETCPLRETCYRFSAEPSEYQTYADFEYDEENGCEYYWEDKK